MVAQSGSLPENPTASTSAKAAKSKSAPAALAGEEVIVDVVASVRLSALGGIPVQPISVELPVAPQRTAPARPIKAEVTCEAETVAATTRAAAEGEAVAACAPSAAGAVPTSLREQALRPELVDAWWERLGLTDEKSAKLDAFRSRVEQEGLLTPWWDNKPTLLRFLAARQYDIPKALVMFRNHLEVPLAAHRCRARAQPGACARSPALRNARPQWRKGHYLDTFVDTPTHGRIPRLLAEAAFPEDRAVKVAYQHSHHRYDKLGRIMYIDRVGALRGKPLKEAATLERLVQCYVWECEATLVFRMPACSLAAGIWTCARPAERRERKRRESIAHREHVGADRRHLGARRAD